MIDLITASADVLAEAGFSVGRSPVDGRDVLLFENDTVLGFLFVYATPVDLVGAGPRDAAGAIAANQFALRRAGEKAWNTYVVFLAAEAANESAAAALAAIEEDLAGTRKIARAGVTTVSDLRAALLPLLPLQSAPRLESVDIVSEIRQRATELAPRAAEAFLSGSEPMITLQILEE